LQANEEELRQVLADVLDLDSSAIIETASIDTIKQWDSLKHLNLVLALEERFGVTFTDEQTIQILSYPLIKITLEEQGVRFNDREV
jgi:acyl carrier protein